MNGVTRGGWHVVVDAAAMTLLALVSLAPLASAFGDNRFWLAAAGGVLIGCVAALLGARLSGGPLEVAGLAVLGYFAFGGVFAVREAAVAGVIPSLVTLRDLALAVVFGWKQLLTVSTPVTGFDQLYAVPYLAGLVGATLAVSFALRLRRHLVALLPVAVLLVFAIAFGDANAVSPSTVGGTIAGIALAWASWRSHRQRMSVALPTAGGADEARRARLRQLALGATALVTAVGVGTLSAAAATQSWDRLTLREQVIPPLELHDYPSPLMSFRKFVEDGTDTTLFTVTGLPAGGAIRMATLDLYDGIVYKVSGAGGPAAGVFTRVGRTIADDRAGESATIRVQIKDLRGVWLPDAGYLTGVDFEGARAEQLAAGMHYNRATGTAVQTAGVSAGDAYTLRARIPSQPTSDELAKATIAQLATPVPEMMPDAIQDLLDDAVPRLKSPIDQVKAIEKYLKEKGFFSHGLEGEVPSRPGHTYERLSSMLSTEQMIGDDEQYAVVMALMLAQAGLPSRVVMGFAPAQTDGAAEIAVTGADVRAWVEVPLEGLGWVAFSPVPDQKPQEQVPQARNKPRVQVPQPPLPPQEPAELPPQPPDADEGEETPGPDLAWLWRVLSVGGMSLAVLAVLLGPALTMVWLKARRRARRRGAASLPDRVSGGWAEVVDAAADVGVPVLPTATRREHATHLAQRYPALDLPVLAARADLAVFGAGEPSAVEVDAFWADVDSARHRIAAEAPLKQRLRRFFAPASVLRRPTWWWRG